MSQQNTIDKGIEMEIEKDIEMGIGNNIKMEIEKNIEISEIEKNIEMRIDKNIENSESSTVPIIPKRSLVNILNRISEVISEYESDDLAEYEEWAEYEQWKKKLFADLMWRAPELSWKGWYDASFYLQEFCRGKKYEDVVREIFNGTIELIEEK